MKQTDFFFASNIDLKDHSLSKENMDAMYAVYGACRAINQPNKYGSSVQTIIVIAIHQDYASKFHKPNLKYDKIEKTIEAGVKVDLDQVLASNFLQTVTIYQNTILQVLDQIKDQVPNFDFEQLKQDLQAAIQNEIKVVQ